MSLFFIVLLVLYGIRKHGSGDALSDYSRSKLPAPPQWAKNGILYQVFTRSFTREGTFAALKNKLPHIKNLGITIIWVMPLFPIGKKGRKGRLGSPYSIQNFRSINPEYGNEEDFRELVGEIHYQGMKIIIGMVPNHGANDNVLMENHPDWFKRDKKGRFTRKIKDWSDVSDFNYENQEFREYMTNTFCYWVKEFDVDGFRMDVAGMVPLDFWEAASKKMQEIKPDVYLLAEWEDPEILLKGFHSDYDWTLYYLLKDVMAGKGTADEIIQLVYERDRLYPRNALPMRFLENHDEGRTVSVFGKYASNALAGLLFTLPGIPMVYCGQELGESDKPSLFEKTALNWDDQNREALEFYKEVISLRKSMSCFTQGELIPIGTNFDKTGAFIRKANQSAALIVFNLSDQPIKNVVLSIPDDLKDDIKNLRLFFTNNPDDTEPVLSTRINSLAPYTFQVFGRDGSG